MRAGGTGDGTSWANASGNIASAISGASVGYPYQAEIWVEKGTYSVTTPLALRNGVSVYGGFSGVETKLAQRDIAAHPTILSGDIDGNDADTDHDGFPDPVTMLNNASSIISNTPGITAAAMLDGFVLSGARSAAIQNSGTPTGTSSPTIANCTFRYHADLSVRNESYSAPAILNCTFHHNAAASGVMLNAVNSAPAVINCTFSKNSPTASAPIIQNQTQSIAPKFFNCTFDVGSTQAAFYNAAGPGPTIRNCIIWGNTAAAGIQGGSAAVSHCVIQEGANANLQIISQDPHLMPLGNYGGPTLTRPVGFGSPAIGQGTIGAEIPSADQRGFSRDALPDIGASEWQQNLAIIRPGKETHALGTRAVLEVATESTDISGIAWQWYLGVTGDTSNPVAGATASRCVTTPLTQDISYWVRGTVSGSPLPLESAVTLKTYAPNVIHVSPTGNDAADGRTWAQAKQGLQAALAASQSGDHIWVAGGTYTFTAGQINLRNGVSVFGGFKGDETRLDQRSGTASILSADWSGDDVDSNRDGMPDPLTTLNNAPVLVSNVQVDSTAILDGFVLYGSTSAAVMNYGSSPTITNCTFRGNAGICVKNEASSSPTILNCTFSGNPSQTPVPIIANQTRSSPMIINCTFAAGAFQTSLSDDFGDGHPTIQNCIIWGNSSASGIQANTASVSHCVIQGGFAGGTSIITLDPLLMPLANYSGPTPTMPVQVCSQAIGQGMTGADFPDTDQRGFIRDAQPDIGACEWQEGVAVVFSGEGTTRYAIGSRAVLSVAYEAAQAGVTWQWYRGGTGDVSNPIPGATLSSYGTPPLSTDAAYWVRGTFGGSTFDSGIALTVYAPYVIHVSPTGNDGMSGSSWAQAKKSLRSALDVSQSGDQIWVAAGLYTNVTGAIILRDGVSFFGGFSGSETRFDERDIAANPTILTADRNGNDIDSNGDGIPDSGTSENDQSLFMNAQIGRAAVLDGFILTGARGVAIFNGNYSSPTIANCTFRFNPGKSIQNWDSSSPDILNCTFHHNGEGQGIISNAQNSSPAVINCTFSAKPTRSPAPIVENLSQSSPQILNCTFAGGAEQLAVYNGSSDVRPTISNCIIWGNTSVPGIFNIGSSPVVSNCVIQGGYAGGTNIMTLDPKLLPLGNYGGPTHTIPVGSGSASINQGATGLNVPAADQRGFVRDAQPDIGACEWQPNLAVVASDNESARYSVGTRAVLIVASESAPTGMAWQWYRGEIGNISAPIPGAIYPRYETPLLTQPGSYWARGILAGGPLDAGIALTVFTPRVIHVSMTGNDTNSGSSWQQAKRSAQSALSISQSGDQIWMAEGTYRETLSMHSGVSVYGGFSGMETQFGQRDLAAHPTILSADINGDDYDSNADGIPDGATSENSPYLVYDSNISASTVLDGLIFSGAKIAAITNYQSSPSISHCTFRFNLGICIQNAFYSSPKIWNCTFHHNLPGRGVWNTDHCSPTVVNCTFGGSPVSATYPIMYSNQQSSSVITNCTFNPGASQPAVFNNTDCSATVSNCIIWGNASVPGIQGSFSSVTNCVIQRGFAAGTNISAMDPLLQPLGNYGGPTLTLPVGAGSPAINQGRAGADISSTDQRGFSRDALPDIGACEFGVGVAALLGEEPAAPTTIGSTFTVSIYTDKANPAYKWYYGVKGDVSHPVPGGPLPGGFFPATAAIGPLSAGTRVWARITPGDGSAAVDTGERTFQVQGTYDQWCDYHGLAGADRETNASVARDGIDNLVKFALGLPPREQKAIGESSTTSFDGSTLKLTQEWRLSKTPVGVTIVFEGSNDLKTWSPVTAVMTGEDAAFETWKASLDQAPAARATFLRTRIIKDPSP